MEYRRFGDKYLVRLNKGEEIITSLLNLAEREDIRLAEINGLGAVSFAEIGLFKIEEKKYYPNEYKGDFEISSLHGNLSTMKGEKYLHLHIIISDEKQQCYGGHLNKAIVSATSEIFVNILDGEIDRYKDEEIGINLIKFL